MNFLTSEEGGFYGRTTLCKCYFFVKNKRISVDFTILLTGVLTGETLLG